MFNTFLHFVLFIYQHKLIVYRLTNTCMLVLHMEEKQQNLKNENK